MNEIFYLETSEEITSVIDRLRASSARMVSFVIPRGATIAQSIVNLKLLKRSAQELDKEISLVSNDRISRNLASQIGLTVYSKVSEAEKARPLEIAKPVDPKESEEIGNMPFKVNNYYKEKSKEEEDEDEEIQNELKSIAEAEKNEEEDKEPEEKSESHESSEEEVLEQKDDERETKGNILEIKMEKRPVVHHDEPKKLDHTPPRKTDEMNNSKPSFGHKPSAKKPKKLLLILGGIFGVIILSAAYLLLPSASVEVTLKTEEFSAEKTVTIDEKATSNDKEERIAKGKLLELEKEISKEYDATGTKDVGTKASGTLTFNNYDGVETAIAAGASIKSSSGVEFTVDQAISIPKATASVKPGGVLQTNPGTASGKVTAKDSGDKGNFPASTVYSVTGKTLVTAAGETTGGVSKIVKIVTENDIKNADASVKTDLNEFAKSDLDAIAKNEKLSIFDDCIKSDIQSSRASKNVNDESDKFEYTLKVKFSTIGFVKADLDELLISAVEKELGKNKMVVAPDKAEIAYNLTDKDSSDGKLTADAKIVGRSGEKLSEEEIKNKIKGKSLSSAEKVISENETVEDVKISMNPKFINQVPFFARNIKLLFGFTK